MKVKLTTCVTIIFICLHIYGCDKMLQNYNKIDELSWLEGEWVSATEEGKLFETWKKENDSTLKGHGFLIEKNDTIFEEFMEIAQRNNKVYYGANPQGQNNNTQVDFFMISDSANKWVFENMEHDFPQRIIYMHPEKNTLKARIEGSVKDKPHGEDFNFTRIEKK